jgi:hypothetical protein
MEGLPVPTRPDDSITRKLLPLLGDADGGVRAAAAKNLGQLAIGARAAVTVDKLLPLLSDPACRRGKRDLYARA